MSRMIVRYEPGPALNGSLVYDDSEYSFRYEADLPELRGRVGGGGVTSITVGTLQVEVDVDSGQALFVWGLHPRAQWTEARLAPPRAQPGLVFFESASPFHEGVSISEAGVGVWSTQYDSETGWVRVAPDLRPDEAQIMIADGVVVGVLGDELHSLWLRPLLAED